MSKSGFIYKTKDGKFLVRILNRGHFDETHYTLKAVSDFNWCCLLDNEIVIDGNDRDSLTGIKYRTLCSKAVIADCVCENVVVSGDAGSGFELEVVG